MVAAFAGPQAITWHGREVAVVLSKAEYERLTGTGQSLAAMAHGLTLVTRNLKDFHHPDLQLLDPWVA